VTGTSLFSALDRAAATDRTVRVIEHADSVLVISYASLRDDALAIGGALHARGLQAGSRVALCFPEVADFVRGFFAIAAAGLVPVPLFPPAQAGDLPTFTRQSRHILDASRASLVITSPDVAPLIDAAGLSAAPAVLTIDQLRGGPALDGGVPVKMSDPALLQFTSGSTAAPKGVVLTHTAIEANSRAIHHGLDLRPDDVGVSWLPLYHDMGLIGMLVAGVYGCVNLVMMSPVQFLKRPSVWLDAIAKYRGTISFAPNFAYELCIRRVKSAQVEALDLSSWRVAGCGAEPVRAETLKAFAAHFAPSGFTPSAFLPSYGLAEHSLAVTFARNGLQVDVIDAESLKCESRAVPVVNGSRSVKIVNCGRAFPGHEVRIVDEHDRPLAERHVGRIVARGPSVMAGYFENPEATAQTLQHGWLHTGDLGYIADGDLFVCGRTKDLIIRQGKKYHPPDLESSIAAMQGMRPSAVVVFGITRAAEADEVVAIVEARASSASDDIREDVRRRIRETAGLEIDHVLIAPPGTIPRTTSGKVRRAETRARFAAGTLLAGGREA
jgi:acyl-CoA synthetase (AMP-forming)/AMP-acid ligase II